MLKQVSDTLLAPSNLSHQSLLNILMWCSHRHIDYADLYFQLSQDESWVLEDSIIKEGGFHIDRGVGVRAVSGEKTGFAYSDQINLASLQQCAEAVKGIAQIKEGNLISPQAFNAVNAVQRYAAINPLESLSKRKDRVIAPRGSHGSSWRSSCHSCLSCIKFNLWRSISGRNRWYTCRRYSSTCAFIHFCSRGRRWQTWAW